MIETRCLCYSCMFESSRFGHPRILVSRTQAMLDDVGRCPEFIPLFLWPVYFGPYGWWRESIKILHQWGSSKHGSIHSINIPIFGSFQKFWCLNSWEDLHISIISHPKAVGFPCVSFPIGGICDPIRGYGRREVKPREVLPALQAWWTKMFYLYLL